MNRLRADSRYCARLTNSPFPLVAMDLHLRGDDNPKMKNP